MPGLWEEEAGDWSRSERTFVVDVTATDTVGTVRERLVAQTKHLVHWELGRPRFYPDPRTFLPLDERRTVEECNLHAGAALHVRCQVGE
eukprot:CAMPEP_0198565112 /NCGR_PEP_ID=MMETSP1462-20131121/101322_1 /TAXON_ID=1333877 /ORGANISM="Brandtodinium nutriculum, Strain RCC3387" /LENGTH=88 /DNA_ID=CAMNT_0044296101 /DNA_START=60 /DNA_END=323 /DNA_ORIENTATION=-